MLSLHVSADTGHHLVKMGPGVDRKNELRTALGKRARAAHIAPSACSNPYFGEGRRFSGPFPAQQQHMGFGRDFAEGSNLMIKQFFGTGIFHMLLLNRP